MKSLTLILVFLVLGAHENAVPKEEYGPGHFPEVSQTTQLNTDGLYFAEFYDYIFRGHFENVEITPEDQMFLVIFGAYLKSFSLNCGEYLPEDKVDIMDVECATESVTRNGFGMETNRTCIEWRTVRTGLYAKPELYQAQLYAANRESSNALGIALQMMADPNAVGNSVDLIHKVNGLKNDMQKFLRMNPCNSPGIKQFEENLKLFALGKPSIRMKEESKYAVMKKTGGPTGTQDLEKLVDDLVIDQSKTWAFNRYIPGSINGLSVLASDPEGRPRELKANYSYNGFSGKSGGWVRVTFTNGLPECIYFFDYPYNCKQPNSSILASYSNGDYKGK